eukprot:TRINITY_DN26585_c0_g1_i1.p1 TRINITY_DN26585_c0_g1~~TRINITY_DN26585_c0_g1_i1.p1  ORF type:complete len:103 (+),score=14.42 TRINITY_DN26585_c0_g1_i1:720-1028(+)
MNNRRSQVRVFIFSKLCLFFLFFIWAMAIIGIARSKQEPSDEIEKQSSKFTDLPGRRRKREVGELIFFCFFTNQKPFIQRKSKRKRIKTLQNLYCDKIPYIE